MALEFEGMVNSNLRRKRIIQVTWLVQSALAAALFLPVLAQNIVNSSILLMFAALMSICRWIAKKEKLDLAANAISFVLAAMILLLCAINEGVRDEVLLVFPALITFSVLTGTERSLWLLYATIACCIMLMGLVNEMGIYQHELGSAGLEPAIVVIIIMSVVTYSIRILGVDITQANKKLQEHQQELEQQVAERTKALEESIDELTVAQAKLVESEKMASLGRLVAAVAHEINTPIGIAVTATSLVEDNIDMLKKQVENNAITRKGLLDALATSSKSVDMIQGNLSRAVELVVDFKQAAVLQTDERKKQLNVFELLETLLVQLRAEAEIMVDAKVLGDENIFVTQDPDVINRIFTNLYTNSCRHGFEGVDSGSITIELMQQSDVITITYIDNGKGVSDENKEHIFEPFFTTKRGKGGTGLGMHIVYNLVTQSLEGHIELTDNKPHGVIFSISFPIA